MNIFFSYPHDHNQTFIERLKADLETRGHEVWFDQAQIKSGQDWRERITRGILESERVVAFLSKHSVRDPGVCLNEIAIAMADDKTGEALVSVLVEPEHEVAAPVSMAALAIQFIRMDEHSTLADDPEWYACKFSELVAFLENPVSVNRASELDTLRPILDPLSFNADIGRLSQGFVGRQWLFAQFDTWLATDTKSRVFRIEGDPGVGKSAVAAMLTHTPKSSVLGVHFCRAGESATLDARRLVKSLAYQIATRLPDYRARLMKVPAVTQPEHMQEHDAASLWRALIQEPLAGVNKANIDRPRMVLIIDGLDEATQDHDNPVVKLLTHCIGLLPSWMAVVLTGRPDPELQTRLKAYLPHCIQGDDPHNRADLQTYIADWLGSETAAWRLPAAEQPALAARLLEQSDGTFLYLRLLRQDAQAQRIDLRQLKALPRGLEGYYLSNFERRFGAVSRDDTQHAKLWHNTVKPALALLIASPEAIPEPIFYAALGWKLNDPDPEIADVAQKRRSDLIKAVGSLVQQGSAPRFNDNTRGERRATFRLHHKSLADWLSISGEHDYFISTDQARFQLTQTLWQHHLADEGQRYPWQVLPQLLPAMPQARRDQVLGEPTRETSQVLYRLAEGLGQTDQTKRAAALWAVQFNMSETLTARDPDNTEFQRNLWVSMIRLAQVLDDEARQIELLTSARDQLTGMHDRKQLSAEDQSFLDRLNSAVG